MDVRRVTRFIVSAALLAAVTCSRHVPEDTPVELIAPTPIEVVPPVAEAERPPEPPPPIATPDAAVPPATLAPSSSLPPPVEVEIAPAVAAPDAGEADAGAPAPSACLKILPLGDSITVGVNGGYRNSLYSAFTAQGCGVDLVGSQHDPLTVVADADHEGHIAFTISDIRAGIDAWLAASAPDYVLLLVGTNDIAWFTNETAAEIADRHAELVDRILVDRPSAWLIVGSIPPITSQPIPSTGVDRATLAAQLNAEIASRVHARQQAGRRVRLADISASLTLADLYDGVHPTLEASAKMTAAWRQALLPLVSCGVAACTP